MWFDRQVSVCQCFEAIHCPYPHSTLEMRAACSSKSQRPSNTKLLNYIFHVLLIFKFIQSQAWSHINHQLPCNVCIRSGWWRAKAWKLCKQPQKCVTFQPQSQTTLSIPNVSHKTFCNRTSSSRTGWQAASFFRASLTLLSSQVLWHKRHETGYILSNKPPPVKYRG